MTETFTDIAAMRHEAADIFHAGLKAVDPVESIRRTCRLNGTRLHIQDRVYDLTRFNNVYVIGAGKASAAMASAMEDLLGNRISGGHINVKYGHDTHLQRIDQAQAGHPIPDQAGVNGAQAIRRMAEHAGAGDLVICLISGGGSALLPCPAQGLTLAHKQETIRLLLACGATIHEINTIRKHTSGIKGGHLARACYPATVVSLILSDVVGDDLDIIASGPTVPDPGTFQDCLDILARHGLEPALPPAVTRRLRKGAAGEIPETPKPGDAAFRDLQNAIIGNNYQALEAAAHHAVSLGYLPLVLSSMFEGETRDAAFFHACIIKEIIKSGHPAAPPVCLLSGGETTVTLKGDGLGGRNLEFALASVLHLEGLENVVLLSAGTDGTDGPTDAAGALVDSRTPARAKTGRLDARDYLERNDSYRFFQQLDDLFITGPTRTNVMDMRIILVR